MVGLISSSCYKDDIGRFLMMQKYFLCGGGTQPKVGRSLVEDDGDHCVNVFVHLNLG